ncbi:uncharacterized protein EAF02_009498 [Botrytis sinoallii]|uniref:uncharacterized protein n=1 Tax=Botrytis sinoallii TaxID=1463999 RepID=UPI001901D69B|nr:uncharacterized protein EAF02_009498 [Botrytis sinoallii]KAF7868762.1 hypothetical protein EAF02_009498 [Botrytis sinoallii]
MNISPEESVTCHRYLDAYTCLPIAPFADRMTSTIGKETTTNATAIDSNNTRSTVNSGWTQSPDGRGSFDILWNCASVMILCSWSILCLNLPAPGETIFVSICRRLWLTALGFLGPEFTLQAAIGQWAAARQSVEEFRGAGIEGWEMIHAFFANAGGFVLKTSDHPDYFVPLNAKQLLHLVKSEYVLLDSTENIKKTVKDRNKTDGVLRAITILQTTWFMVNFLTRLIEHLPVTGLEITTVAFILCALGTSVCWWYKPADVTTPVIISSQFTIAEIQNGAAVTRHDHSPLDCIVSRQEWPWSRSWQHWINILRWMRIEKVLFVEYANEAGDGTYITRIENTYWYELNGGYMSTFALMSISYPVIFLSSWNETFPTHVEQFLWRISCVALAATIVIYFVVVVLWCSESEEERKIRREIWEQKAARRQRVSSEQLHGASRFNQLLHKTTSLQWLYDSKAKIINNSKTNDPLLDVNPKAQVSMYVCAFIYCCARTYLYIADLTQLRSMPKGAYETVHWPSWFPHIE